VRRAEHNVLELLLQAHLSHLVVERHIGLGEDTQTGAMAQAAHNHAHLKYGWFDSQITGINGGDGDWDDDCDGAQLAVVATT
jgi:hypothetical protein